MVTHTGLSTTSPSKKLEAFYGITEDIQLRVGTIVILWAKIEQCIELALWTIEGEKFIGGRPSTDTKTIGDLCARLNAASQKFDCQNIGAMLHTSAKAIQNFSEVRNTIVHGRPLSDSAGTPMLIRNDSILGETRKRPKTLLSVSEITLHDIALSLDLLFIVISRLSILFAKKEFVDSSLVTDLKSDLEAAAQKAQIIREAIENTQIV